MSSERIPGPGRWDIFCTVVDNFGDIGVCWRLSRQLAVERGIAVRLWVDDLSSFQRICPDLRIEPQQWQQGVEVRHWRRDDDFSDIDVADVVVEAFACAIPAGYLAALIRSANTRVKPPLWLNLEYLTAEMWAGEYHKLPSIEPKSGLCKYFFFPGFVPETGGLLREASLFAERDVMQDNSLVRAEFLQSLGVDAASDALLVSLFAYENSALSAWLDAMSSGARPIHLLVPEGRITAPVQAYLGQILMPGVPVTRGSLRVQALPFVAQPDFDRLLWCCDINMVRGEDSLIRAIWAGRPLLWHCYPQADEAHMVKLQALLDLYCRDLSVSAAAVVSDLSRAWNQGDGASLGHLWPDLLAHQHELSAHAKRYASTLSQQSDLARQMLQFYLEMI